MFGLFKAAATPEQEFWKWFQKNETMLFNFEKDRESVFDQLSTQMKKVHESLTFEFGPVENGKRDFVISADGIKKGFPAVETLYASAPKLERWTFIKFRPRREAMDIDYAGVSVKTGDVFCTVQPDRGKAGITVFLRNYRQENQKAYAGITFLMLDQALGEYDVETRVGFIQTKPFSDPSDLEKKPLKELTKVFDDFWKYQEGNTNQLVSTNAPVMNPQNK
jgi:hypothetical protein